MTKTSPDRRAVLAGLTVLPAAAVAHPAHATPPEAATKPDGSPRHDPVMPDTEHTRTYLALARN